MTTTINKTTHSSRTMRSAAILIAWWTRSVPLTLVGGIAALWVLQAVGLGS